MIAGCTAAICSHGLAGTARSSCAAICSGSAGSTAGMSAFLSGTARSCRPATGHACPGTRTSRAVPWPGRGASAPAQGLASQASAMQMAMRRIRPSRTVVMSDSVVLREQRSTLRRLRLHRPCVGPECHHHGRTDQAEKTKQGQQPLQGDQ